MAVKKASKAGYSQEEPNLFVTYMFTLDCKIHACRTQFGGIIILMTVFFLLNLKIKISNTYTVLVETWTILVYLRL